MEIILLTIHIISAICLIGFILIQQGKGSEVGASFGAGASQTIFGSQGSGSFLTRITAILVTIFFITSLALGYLVSHHKSHESIEELLKKAGEVQETPNTVLPKPKSPSPKGGEDVPE